jgi:hypothetical protein
MFRSVGKYFVLLLGLVALAAPIKAALAGQAYIVSVTMSPTDSNGVVPGINEAVKNGMTSSVGSLDTAFPVSVLQNGDQYIVTFVTQFGGLFKGTSCTDTWSLMRGTTTIATGTAGPVPYDCAAGAYLVWFSTTAPIPDSPGAATLVGTLTYTGKQNGKVTFKVPVLIQ